MLPINILIVGMFFILVWIGAPGLARPRGFYRAEVGSPDVAPEGRRPAVYIHRWWTPKEYG